MLKILKNSTKKGLRKTFSHFSAVLFHYSTLHSASFVLSRYAGFAPAAPIPFSRSAQSDLRVCSFLSSLGKKETDGGRASPAEEFD